MKKKLRIVPILLMAAVMSAAACIGLGGCGYKGKFFDKQHLEEHLVPDLPKPSFKVKEDSGSAIVFLASKEEVELYIEEIFHYLVACNFQNLGKCGEAMGSPFITYSAIPCTELSEFRRDSEADFTTVSDDGEMLESACYLFIWQGKSFTDDGKEVASTHSLKLTYEKENTKSLMMGLCHKLVSYSFEK